MVQSTFAARMIGAATVDVATYEEVEHDTDATMQAAAVVVLAAIAQGLGSPYVGVISGIIGSLIGWAALAGLTYFIGTKLFNGTATWGELLRTLGFAMAPAILSLLGILPILGVLVSLVVFFWVLVTVVVGIRQALDITTGQAVVTGILGVLAWGLIQAVIPGL